MAEKSSDESEYAQQLMRKIAYKADIELVFVPESLTEVQRGPKAKRQKCSPVASASTNKLKAPASAGSNTSKLQINSHMLSAHSPVLAPMIELAQAEGDTRSSSSAASSSANSMKKLPIVGTTKEDFITVLSFIYPMNPLPKVTWDNLEVLLVEGNKWDMQLPLAHASEFIQARRSELSFTTDSKMFAFKWLQLADQAGLENACNACVEHIAASQPKLCTKEYMERLSCKTMMHAIECLAGVTAKATKYCSWCGVNRSFVPCAHERCASCYRAVS